MGENDAIGYFVELGDYQKYSAQILRIWHLLYGFAY